MARWPAGSGRRGETVVSKKRILLESPDQGLEFLKKLELVGNVHGEGADEENYAESSCRLPERLKRHYGLVERGGGVKRVIPTCLNGKVYASKLGD